MRRVLGGVESAVDHLALALIDLVPVCEKSAKTDKAQLDASLREAINVYTG